jgi:hypothetical protein
MRATRICGGIGLAVLCLWICGRAILGIGPIHSPQNWPHGLEVMAQAAGARVQDIKVECIDSAYLDSEYLWRMTVPADRLEQVVSACDMKELKPGKVPPEFWNAFRLWRLPPDQKTRWFATPNFPARERGEDGEHSVGRYSPADGSFFVWHKFNF